MIELSPLQTLFDLGLGDDLPLSPELTRLYGRLQLPPHKSRHHMVGNFVTTLDGVVSLNVDGLTGGGEISGFNMHDKMVMGLLRSAAGAVIVGAGTLRSVPNHLWTADYIYPPLAGDYGRLRTSLGMVDPPLNVIVTAQGDVDLDLPVFQSGRVPALIVTTERGSERLRSRDLPNSVLVREVGGTSRLSARAILDAVNQVSHADLILVEGGPHLMADFLAEKCLDELFLTVAPQIAGRDGADGRPGLVEGRHFAPDFPLWGKLLGAKRSESHLFLRYSFD